jgi:LysR family transcriptional regulator, nitrogen assimilation regulatory protein
VRQIEFFIHVAESGCFSRASAMMGLTQPAISRQVSALKRELRPWLLHRNCASAREGRHAVTGNEVDLTGKVAVGLPPSLGQLLTLPLVKAFRERYPGAELAIVEALSVPLQEQLLLRSCRGSL